MFFLFAARSLSGRAVLLCRPSLRLGIEDEENPNEGLSHMPPTEVASSADQLGLDLTCGHVPQFEGIDQAVLQQAADDVREDAMSEEELEHEVLCWLVGTDWCLWELVEAARDYYDDIEELVRGYCAEGHWQPRDEAEA
jgi:hypothetical protein